MPSKSKKQHNLMKAIARGWEPDRLKHPPSPEVAREFLAADKKLGKYKSQRSKKKRKRHRGS